MNQETGKYILLIGLGLSVLGILIYFFHDKLQGLGRLPGDIRISRGKFRFYFPLTTMILISLLLTLILRIFRRS
jgi:hypothetical protein